ncbi:MAG: pyruvate kinase, partial [Alphaproteobacteria bacterium]|nr:pyruvate kinase [Alphaproteobacteria bacterium]
MKRERNAKILATLGPASATASVIADLFEAGADAFRLNFSHGTHDDHRERYQIIREIERTAASPIGVVCDLQGPKLRVGKIKGGKVALEAGQPYRLDTSTKQGDRNRARLPHKEVFAALEVGMSLLLDDGRIRLEVERCGADFAETVVITGGVLSDRKGVNVPDAVLPLKALTPKDRRDLAFAVELGVDWVALSFVQRPEDIAEARKLSAGRVGVMAKIEKPAAVERFDEILEQADGIMVARGDLGVEMPPEEVPRVQKQIVRAAREAG